METVFTHFDALDVPVFVIGRQDDDRIVYLYCNTASREMLGRDLDELVGRTAVEVFGDRLGRRIGDHHRAAIARGRRFSYDVTLPVSQGEWVMSNTMTPLPGHPGVVVGTTRAAGSRLEHGRDLTRQAREVEREAALAQRAQGLRGPMRKFSLLVEELKDGFTDLGNGKLQLIDEIGRLGADAYELVRQVLVHTRASTAQPLAPDRVELEEFCETLFATFDPEAKHRLVAERSSILVEQAVLWFVLHELLSKALASDGCHAFAVGARPDGQGLLRVTVRCSASSAGDVGAEEDFTEIERVLRSRGGKLIHEEAAAGRQCSFTLPGRSLGSETIADEDGSARPVPSTAEQPQKPLPTPYDAPEVKAV